MALRDPDVLTADDHFHMLALMADTAEARQ